jgi:MraZ protein
MLDNSTQDADYPTFSGTEDASIDDKGRLLVIKKKRDKLGENFVLALSEVGAVAAYPKSTWMAMMAEIKKVPMINLGRQQYGRLVVTTAYEDMNFDAQGRVVIPSWLRDQGKIVDKVVVAGNIEKVEIWAKSEWEAWKEDSDNYGIKRIKTIERAMELMAVR